MNIAGMVQLVVLATLGTAPLAAQVGGPDREQNAKPGAGVPGWEVTEHRGPSSRSGAGPLRQHEPGWELPDRVSDDAASEGVVEDLVTTTPEPATMLLLAAGLVMLAVVPAMRRRSTGKLQG